MLSQEFKQQVSNGCNNEEHINYTDAVMFHQQEDKQTNLSEEMKTDHSKCIGLSFNILFKFMFGGVIAVTVKTLLSEKLQRQYFTRV